jgi:hypothetical protein
MTERSQFRPVNQSLGQQPSLGPIPANLLAPLAGILVGFYILFVAILHIPYTWFLLLSIWGIAGWWVVVGQKTWKFTHKFTGVPDWKRGHLSYHCCLREEDDDSDKTSSGQ